MTYENRLADIDRLKKEIDKLRPLNSHQLKQLKEYYRVGLTYSSNALEGNSLTETETKIVLEDGLTIGGKPLRDHYEATGHGEAFDRLNLRVQSKKITEKNILELHQLFYYRLDAKRAGIYRKEKVIITGTPFVPPEPKALPSLMKKFVSALSRMKKKYHPVEFSALAHLDFVEIHPFVDGNGRTARLLMNLILLQAGYVVTIIPPMLRQDYIQAIKKAQIEPKSKQPFIHFISAMVYESMKDHLRLMKAL